MTQIIELQRALIVPPHPRDLSWKPQTVDKTKRRAQLVAYLDGQYYEDRLDQVVEQGLLARWSDETFIAGTHGQEVVATCALHLYTPDGTAVRHTGVGTGATGGASKASPAKSAATDAFKRACARAGLGRLLYSLPKLWAPTDEEGRLTRETRGRLPDLTRQILERYQAGDDQEALDSRFAWLLTREEQTPPTGAPAGSPPNDELAGARQHLTALQKRLTEEGKGSEVNEVLRQHPDRLRDVDSARAAYRALNQLKVKVA